MSIVRSPIAVLGVLMLAACSQPASAPPALKAVALAAGSPVERGKYLVSTSACHDCHTPHKMGPTGPEPDMARMLSGHPEDVKVDKGPKLEGRWMVSVTDSFTAWSGPWGISYTANLTPDPSGLGAWTEDMFMKAIRTGKHMGVGGSRDILPPMPWPVYRNFTDDDLKAIFAYLKSIPPVRNHVPEPIIAEPPAGEVGR
jgi:Cytochrome c